MSFWVWLNQLKLRQKYRYKSYAEFTSNILEFWGFSAMLHLTITRQMLKQNRPCNKYNSRYEHLNRFLHQCFPLNILSWILFWCSEYLEWLAKNQALPLINLSASLILLCLSTPCCFVFLSYWIMSTLID